MWILALPPSVSKTNKSLLPCSAVKREFVPFFYRKSMTPRPPHAFSLTTRINEVRWNMCLSKAPLFRIASITIVALLSLLIVIFAFANILAPILIFLVPAWEPALYDLGVYGPYRTTKFVSTTIEPPKLSIPVWNSACDDGRSLLLTPKGEWIAQSGPTILDARGELVWMSSEYRNAMNLNLQTYKGERYLTFWTGEKAASSGQGVYSLLDSTYTEAMVVRPHGEELHADLHEFQITADDTGLFTIYNTSRAEMSIWGRKQMGYITESSFQEVNIATGELLFEWRATDHYSLDDSYYWAPMDGSEDSPLDWFHINSIKKDSKGNYLVSSRHLHMICCISPSGKVLWTLGGKKNDFQDLSGGKATNFQWQHDARWVDEEKGILTLYDNGYAGPVQSASRHSRAVMLHVDVKRKTVTLMHEYFSLRGTRAASQGSVQVTGSGTVLVGWGHSAVVSEFMEDGELLCEWHLGPTILDYFNYATSYRALKTDRWVGKPKTKPQAVIKNGKLYVSWNGATEVANWSVQATRMYPVEDGADEGEYEEVDVKARDGFETVFVLPDNHADFASIRVAAIDKDGQQLGFSETVRVVREASIWNAMFVVTLIVGFLVGGWIFYVKAMRKENLELSTLPARCRHWTNSTAMELQNWSSWSMYRYRKLG